MIAHGGMTRPVLQKGNGLLNLYLVYRTCPGKLYRVEKRGKLNEAWPRQGLGASVGFLQVPCPALSIRWWDGWKVSPTQWSWVWADSGSWWKTGKPGVLQSMGSQRVRRDWVTELNALIWGSHKIWETWQTSLTRYELNYPKMPLIFNVF